jgi:LmbE family N-acetylglucosaminyl deacetylase
MFGLFYPYGIILQAVAIMHFVRRRPDTYWLWIILIGGGLGAAAYIFLEVIPDAGLLRSTFQVFPRRRHIKQLQAAILDNPSVGNYEELGDLYLEDNKYAEARECFDKVIASRTTSLDAYYRRALAALALEDYPAAVADLEHVVARDPKYDYQRAAGLLAHALGKVGQGDRGLAIFADVTELSTLSETQYNYAALLAEKGKNAEAREWADKLLRKKATMPNYLRRRERLWFRKAAALIKKLPKAAACLAFLFLIPFSGLIPDETTSVAAQAQRPLRIIAFGAHPDDAELKASGVAALWAAGGHKVKFVAMTNGDVGHFEEAGGPLAKRRKAEVAECAKILGIETDVLDIHDGELVPSLENRKTMARLIREWQADIVMGHRPYDYHPDHRYTGVLMDDSAIVVVAPFFVPDTPPTPRNPVYMYYSDGFQDPKPFTPTIVVGIDEVAEKKWRCVSAMPSQFGDKDSWQGRTIPNIPTGDRERQAYLLDIVKKRNMAVADQYRDRLVALYGAERGKKVQYAEAFQLGQYGRQASVDELKSMFPVR